MRLHINARASVNVDLGEDEAALLGISAPACVLDYLSKCPMHRQTPLYDLPKLASDLGLHAVHVKDESERLGLGSFKAIGGAYAVFRLVHETAEKILGYKISPSALLSDGVRAVAGEITFCCATDGNHGRSVAAGARLLGARAVILVHAGVSAQRVQSIAALGAEIHCIDGTYDDSVNAAKILAESKGWHLVSDTSWPGYARVPGLVMQGYTVLAEEAFTQLANKGIKPTHIFLQAGVGGFAAAIGAHTVALYGKLRPKLIVVEPALADCIISSIEQQKSVTVAHTVPTVMSMLECYEPSITALDILSRFATAFLTIDDSLALEAMRRLALPEAQEPAIVSGESGAAGLAGLMAVMRDAEWRQSLGMKTDSVVLLFNTEGASDEKSYCNIVGMPSADIISSRNNAFNIKWGQ